MHRIALSLSLLYRVIVRNWIRHWARTVALIAIVSLGTSVYLSISLANRAATQSFESFAETISGKSQLVLTSATGSLRREDLKDVQASLKDIEAYPLPIVESVAAYEDERGANYFTLIGVDLLALSNVLARDPQGQTYWDSSPADDSSLWDILRLPNAFFSEGLTAKTFAWSADSTTNFLIGERSIELKWAGLFPKPNNEPDHGSQFLVLDWNDLATLANRENAVDRIDIIIPDTAGQQAQRIRKATQALQLANPGHWNVESQDERKRTGSAMSLALRMNLRALSYLALAVAIILVFQSLDTAVAQRRKEISILRSLGISPRQTMLLWLSESLLLGIIGGALGVALSSVIARFSVGAVGETVSLLYYFTDNSVIRFHPGEAAIAWALSIVSCIGAGMRPAIEASRNPPAQNLRRHSDLAMYPRKRYYTAAAILSACCAMAYLTPPLSADNGHSIPIGGYLLAITLIALAIVLACLALETLGAATGWAGNRSKTLRLGLSPFRRPATRHRLALGGIIVSLGMTLSMAFLISSFETTVKNWIGTVLKADLFVSPKAMTGLYSNARIDPSTIEALQEQPYIERIGTLQSTSVRIQGLSTTLTGFDTSYLIDDPHFVWISAPGYLADLRQGNNALVNESFAERFSVRQGQSIDLATSSGILPLKVIGIFSDYGSEQGQIGVDQSLFQKITGDASIRNIAAHLKSNTNMEQIIQDWRSEYPGLQIVANRTLREETLRIFRSVFSITYALQFIGLFIAVSGLTAMLFSSLLERKLTLDALRRMGAGRRQLARSALAEGTVLATLGCLAGIGLGLALGLVLVFIINKQSFGWTLSVSIPWFQITAVSSLVIAFAAIVSYAIGHYMGGRPLQREE